MAAPKSGEYSDGKLWFTRKLSVVTVGLTSAGLDEIGDVQSIELPAEGDDLGREEIAGQLEGANTNLELVSPAAGIVREVNESLLSDLSKLNDDPMEEGWLFKIEIEDPSELESTAD